MFYILIQSPSPHHHTTHTHTIHSCHDGRDMVDDDATANVTDGEGSTREPSQVVDINSPSSPLRPAFFRGAGGGAGVGRLRQDPSMSVGPRVHSNNILSSPMPPSLLLAAETSSYYSNHYNRRWNAWKDIRFKTWKEVSEL